MAAKDLEFRVGIIILLGIVILGVSLFWLRDYNLERNSYKVTVTFKNIGTLEVGDRVNVAGVRMGKVQDVKLTETGVEVLLLLSKEVILREDSKFVVKNLGMMGDRFVSVEMGSGKILEGENQSFVGGYDTGIPEVMGLMGEMIVELRSLVGSIKRTIGSDSTLNKFDQTIASLDEVSASMSDYLKRNEGKLDKTVDNIYSASQKINKVVSGNVDQIDSTINRVDRLTYRLENFTGQLDTLALSFREFADNINNPEGTLQLLTEDRRLYDDLRKTADNIDDLVTDIKTNPKKYINLKVEIF